MAKVKLEAATLRAWWFQKQGLDGSMAGKPAAEVLAKTGWARSVGGVGPYVTLFARAGTTREAADAAVANIEIHELPAARGCTYVLPAKDFALGLKVGQPFTDSEGKVAAKLGVTEKELEKLSETVLKVLAKGPLDPDELKSAAGPAVRNLGEEGKKKGLTTTLPVALGRLQSTGEIRRVPTNGRLDQQRYRYTLWKPNPLEKYKASLEEGQVQLARRYWGWTGPASLAEFQWFSAMGAKASRTIAESLKLVPLGDGDERLMFPDDRDALLSFRAPKEPRYALTSSLDGITLLRRDVAGLLEEKDRKFELLKGNLADLPSHAILDRGRIVGLWEYDPESQTIAWTSFVKADKALKDAVARMESYVRDQLGDARSFSLDSPKSRAPRIAALRKAGA